MESEDQLIARYAGGLKHFIQDKLPLHKIFDLADVINILEQLKMSSPNGIFFPQVFLQRSNLLPANYGELWPAPFCSGDGELLFDGENFIFFLFWQ